MDAGPVAPYTRVVNKLPPLPRQANLAQIFVGFDRGAAPWLPPAAKKRKLAEAKSLAEHIAEEAKRGADFDALAKKESEWPLSDRNGAAFGVLTEGSENMLSGAAAQIFALKVGEVSEPIESPLGYHVVKRLPAVHVAHISINVSDGHSGPPARTREEAKALADKISQSLKAGGDFAAAAFASSDDLVGAGRGGDLGILDARSQSKSPLFKAASGLAVGAVSDPVETAGGYEIVKRLE
jgi:parvulin-like peptidyl-prolyl isomerase